MKDANKFLEMLEAFIEAVIDDKGGDYIEDRVYRIKVRERFLALLKDET